VTERWVDVPGHEGLYEVSTYGNVRSVARYINTGFGRRWQAQALTYQGIHRGYAYVFLNKKGKRKVWRVNRLVLTAFVGPQPMHIEAMHVDPDSLNNCLDNLQWGTAEQNRQERYERLHNKGMNPMDAIELLQRIQEMENKR